MCFRAVCHLIWPPFSQHLSGMAQAGEQRLVQTFVAQAGVEALDKPVLLWFAWREASGCVKYGSYNVLSISNSPYSIEYMFLFLMIGV